MKRLFDILLSFFGLTASFPLWLIISVAVWLEDRGPIFYRQERVGKNGRLFLSLKFRSMKRNDGAGPVVVQARENDPRITGVGKVLRATAMDELPQLLSILKGDMSFVGPRALAPKEREVGQAVERSVFDIPGFKERASIRPGLTGVAQVIGTHDLPREIKFKYDIWYVRHHNLLLDAYLICLSFLVTFLGKWESRQGKVAFIARHLKERVDKEAFR